MNHRTHIFVPLMCVTFVVACTDDRAANELPAVAEVENPVGSEAVSLLGEALTPPTQPDEVREVYLARYSEAEEALAADPSDADALIWMGRRTAYLGQYREAIGIYTDALDLHPEDARLYRHRGHRYLTVRELDAAIADFETAAALIEGTDDEIEPDGLPNRLNQPLSTLHFNIWYHLALGHYVQGEWEQALEAQRECLAVSTNPDLWVATSYWLYMTLMRLGREEEAAGILEEVSADMEIIENDAYHRLLLLFKGELSLDDLVGEEGEVSLQGTTTAYGIGVWHLLEGRTAEAHEVWETVLAGRNQWPAFGYLAAEGELARSAIR